MLKVGLLLWAYLGHKWTDGLEADLLNFVLAELDKLAPGSLTEELVHKLVGDFIAAQMEKAKAAVPAA